MSYKSKKTGRILIVIFLMTAFTGLLGCEDFKVTQPAVDPSATWSLQTDIQPIFNNNCVSCHGGSRSPDLREGKSFQSLTNSGYVNLPADASRLYSKMNSGDHISRSTETERLKVLYWITQGAQNN
jgi:mono/diheme cytochrome c family protein